MHICIKKSIAAMMLCGALINTGCASNKEPMEKEPRSLYIQTMPNPISYEILNDSDISINQGKEFLNESEMLFSTDGIPYTYESTSFGKRQYILKEEDWETYNRHVSNEIKKYNGDKDGCYFNKGLWDAMSDIVIETDKWRLTIINPSDILATSKDGKNHYIVFDNLKLDDNMPMGAVIRHDTIVIHGTPAYDYDFIETPSFTDHTGLYRVNMNKPIAYYETSTDYSHGCNAIEFTIQEIPQKAYDHSFKVTDELIEYRTDKYATIKISTSEIPSD